jgi:hypothetical protein
MHDAFGIPWSEFYDQDTEAAWTVKSRDGLCRNLPPCLFLFRDSHSTTLNRMLFVTCAEYNSYRPYREMLTYKPLNNNAVLRKIRVQKQILLI